MGDGREHDSVLFARRARSFGAAAAGYDAHRPDYPIAGVRWALAPVSGAVESHDRAGLEVLDLGAGTGKLTGVLLAAGARVTAVDPDPQMCAALTARYREVRVLAGTAEAIPLDDDSVDAVVAGQAFHWFDPGRALPEIARVLRPGGVVAAFWNAHDTSVEWVAGLDRVSRSSVSSAGSLAERVPAHPLFHPFERTHFPHVQRRTAESLTATIGTHSHTLVVSAAERAEVLDRITSYLRTCPETAAGEFDMPLRTLVFRAVTK
ncbi:methyltransferase domain-containing protein [Nocardia sp. SYP-A9097]|uniref:class I SAM-dependent methyltransferase n=1 Tax=Nocardia sp. SYP-A9097 TaxID=2663237 RepID=UPI00129B0F6C|nr:class I SAM-dependent methyltransferase [Nocardia sp. SYP-A9097]MRH90173.1 methyltransferase domain-containing protein [Nocardia sp. SYP-A9097]